MTKWPEEGTGKPREQAEAAVRNWIPWSSRAKHPSGSAFSNAEFEVIQGIEIGKTVSQLLFGMLINPDINTWELAQQKKSTDNSPKYGCTAWVKSWLKNVQVGNRATCNTSWFCEHLAWSLYCPATLLRLREGVLSDGNTDLLSIMKQECIWRPSARTQGLWAGHQSAAKPGMFVEDRAGSQMQVRRHGVWADGKPLCALSWKSALEEVRARVSEGQGNGSLGWHSGKEVQEIGSPQWPQVHRTLLQDEQGHQGRGGLGLTAPEHTDLS